MSMITFLLLMSAALAVTLALPVLLAVRLHRHHLLLRTLGIAVGLLIAGAVVYSFTHRHSAARS